MLLLVLYYIAVQFLVKGLLRPVLPLRCQRLLIIFLLPALGDRQVPSVGAVLRAVFFVEGLRLAVFLLPRLNNIPERSARTSLCFYRLLLQQNVALLRLHFLNTAPHARPDIFLLAQTVL